MNRLWTALLPELRRFPLLEQEGALRDARATALQTLELLGMAAGLVAVTALTSYGLAGSSMAARFGAATANFVVALPLLVLVLGPFHLRRLRRGLRELLQRRSAAGAMR
ncbi:MAG: hypothetical protein JNL85_06290 [Rubrivivax sp.]|nr:hypothetical protein [Rubrivivax sp.]